MQTTMKRAERPTHGASRARGSLMPHANGKGAVGKIPPNKKQVVITAQANEFIFSQPIPVINRFVALIRRLETVGQLMIPDAKKIDDDLFELRLRYENNQYRAFYCYAVGDLIYVLSGFVKKTQKTPVQEIRRAHKIMKGLGL